MRSEMRMLYSLLLSNIETGSAVAVTRMMDIHDARRPIHPERRVPVLTSILFLLLVSLVYGLAIVFGFYYLLIGTSDNDSGLVREYNAFETATKSFENITTTESVDEGGVVECETTKGKLRILLDPIAAPKGVKELKRMVRTGFMEDIAFFRVNDDITQFGVREKIHKYDNPNWERDLNNPDRTKRVPWKRGVVGMIGGTQMVIVKKDSRVMGLANHDTVVGRVPEEDMAGVIDQLYRYNDIIDHPKRGPGPDQSEIYRKGWAYLQEKFPLVDKIIACRLK